MADRNATVYLRGDISDYNRAMLAAAAGTKAFVRELDTSNDRMSMLVQTSLALGPALVPIGAAAVPALAGLTNQLAIATGGAGVAILAFQGIGDALKATNEYAIEPSVANFDKMQQSLSEIGPAGREFVGFLQQIRPELQQLQDAAQAGLLPGAEEGIRALMTELPQAERIVTQFSEGIGQLLSEAGANLAGPRWSEFFDFIEREAKPTLLDFGRSIGNLAEGFANLWMAFDPISDRFSDSFLEMSRDFAKWTDGLDQTKGFQDFINYLDETGPQVWETLGAVGNALVQLVEAAAPVGAVMLPMIESLADAFAAVADSDIGPVLIGAAAGISVLSRSMALLQTAQTGTLGTLLGKSAYGGLVGGAKDLPAASRAYLDFGAALDSAGPKVGKFATTTQRLGASLRGGAGIAAGIGGLAFVMSDLDDKAGLSNTAMLALAGSAAGPLGAALGGAAGYTLDLVSANNSLWESLERVSTALESGPEGIVEQSAAIDEARQKIADTQAEFDSFSFLKVKNAFLSTKNSIEDIFGDSDIDEAYDALAGLEDEYRSNVRAAQDLRFEEAGLAGDMDTASASTRQQADEVLALVDAHNRLADQLLASRDANRAYEQAIDDANKAARKNGPTLDINTQRGRDNQEALDGIAAAWNNLTPAQQNAEDAAKRAKDEFVAVAQAMGLSEKAAKKLAKKYLDIPTKVNTTIYADDKASGTIKAIDTALRRLDGKVARTTIETIRRTITQKSDKALTLEQMLSTQQADGSVLDFFAHGGLRENHVAQIAPAGAMRVWAEPETGGEAYIPFAPSKRPRSRAIATETVERLGGAVEWFADGGITNAVSGLDLLRMKLRIRDLQRDLAETERYGKGKKKRTRYALRGDDRSAAVMELQEARQEYAAQAAFNAQIPNGMSFQAFNAGRSARDDFFSFSAAQAATPASLERTLQRMVVDSAEFITLLSALDRAGASDLLLKQLMDFGPSKATNRTARALLNDQERFSRINALSSQAGALSGIYGQLTTNPGFLGNGAAGLGAAQLAALQAALGSMTFVAQVPDIAVASDGLVSFVQGQIVMTAQTTSEDLRFA